jgi:membrane dipeptidase
MNPPLVVDAHEDLAYNMLAYGREYTRPVAETRGLETEAGSPALTQQGHTLLGWDAYQQGRVAVVFSTLFVTPAHKRKDWETIYYRDYDQAHQLYWKQLDLYNEITDRHPDHFQLISTRLDLERILAHWSDDTQSNHPVGLLPLMEGAEGVRSPKELETWWEAGVRIIGPAWAGTRFCGGTSEPGPLTEDGRWLLKAMAAVGFTLDISHMDELSARQALDYYPGAIIASHANAAALIPSYSGNRQLTDAFIRALVERDGIIGIIPTCSFLDYGWKRGDPRDITLEMVAAQVDHICQLAGSADHVGFGSDFDGGFGLDVATAEVDSIADLQKLAPLLGAKGYNEEQVASIFGGNWIKHLQAQLP